MSCNNNENYKKISNIAEASGICYSEKNDTFFVVNDEGNIYKLNKEGTILKKKFIGNYDLESIICLDNELLVIDEKTGNILKIDLENFNILEKYKIFGYNLEKKGIEGFIKISDNKYIISTQSEKKENLLFLEFSDEKFKVTKKIKLKYKDLSGLSYNSGFLYILSDKNDIILKYDLEKKEIIQKIKLKKGAWEGITFDEKGNIFLTDDDGKIVKI
ncbi:MAG: SdiA-regulated domain-containing protein [Candidatus Gracilibacteria bacterium]|nr:SdiA-regulated domain-containing protein [Candidatus Gracilibacteria bacterium]